MQGRVDLHHFGEHNKFCTPTRDVSHYGLAIYIKSILRQKKKKLWKLKYFTMQKYINLQNNPLNKETKILQDIIIL
jgi:hypothetical protein